MEGSIADEGDRDVNRPIPPPDLLRPRHTGIARLSGRTAQPITIKLADVDPAPPFERTDGRPPYARIDIVARRIRKAEPGEHIIQT